VSSRKRKLRELFAVATDENVFPTIDPNDATAPSTITAEKKFLINCDISMYVISTSHFAYMALFSCLRRVRQIRVVNFVCSGRKVGELDLPPYREYSFDVLKRLLAALESASLEALQIPSKRQVESGLPTPVNDDAVGLDQSHGSLPTTNGLPRSPSLADATLDSREPRIQTKPIPHQHGVPPKQQNLAGPGVAQPAHHPVLDVIDKSGETSNQASRPSPLPSEERSIVPTPRFDDKSPPTPEPLPQIDQDQGQSRTNDGVSDSRSMHGDLSRYPDALSSPGSTAQSTLTTTVHEDSADTSPGHEEPQYSVKVGRDGDEKAEDDREGESEISDAGKPEFPEISGQTGSARTRVSGVEAQLLEESAAAQLTRSAVPDDPVKSPANAISPIIGRSEDKLAEASTGHVHRDSETPPVTAALGPPHEASYKDMLPTDAMDVDLVQNPTLSTAAGILAGQVTVSGATHKHVPPVEASCAEILEESRPPGAMLDASHAVSPAIRPADAADVTAGAPPLLSLSHDEKGLSHQTLSAPQLKLLTRKAQDQRRRRSVPTVIFGKQAKKSKTAVDDSSLMVSREQQGLLPTDDYFTPLFIEGFTRQSSWMKPIEKLLNQAHKTVSTSDQYVSILDHQACKILRRVYHLQQHDKWSLRQPVRCLEPTRPPSHWDVLLQEMKWMRTDFREERKWKRAVARNLATACAEWVSSNSAERLALQVNAVRPPTSSVSPAVLATAMNEFAPELVHSDSPMDHVEEISEISIQTIAPSAIFAMPDDEVVFSLQPSKIADELLANLPMYGSPLKVPKSDPVVPEYDPDASWRRPAVPVSKYVEGEMVLAAKPPPRKRSRYCYESDSDSDDEVIFGAKPDNGSHLQPEIKNIALFDPEMKATRDRLHASHQFRPPTDHMMPAPSFYECRTASQWTWNEDNQLKALVVEYSYNWSLISSIMSTRSLFASGAERRTPWECFERWINLEGMPPEFARSPYFRGFQARVEAAQMAIVAHNEKAQQQAAGPNGSLASVPKRRPTVSVRVERRRNQKHLAIIDGMRKLAKKREAAAHKAQQVASNASMRKANEPPRQQVPNKTPKDYSLMRWERDQQLAERMAHYARRSELHKRASVTSTHFVERRLTVSLGDSAAGPS